MKEILVVESGSSKTQWTIIQNGQFTDVIHSNGLNASYMDRPEIERQIAQALDEQLRKGSFADIFYYGAGCSGEERIEKVKSALRNSFPAAVKINVYNDLYASAKSLLGNESGLVGILGTGANIGYYDGTELIQKFPAVGYLLGDEGGGVSLGRSILKAYLMKDMDDALIEKFYEEYGMNDDELIVSLYKSPQPNKWMASFTTFMAKYREYPSVSNRIAAVFDQYFEVIVKPYQMPTRHPLNLTGSIAAVFRPELEKAALKHGIEIAKVVKEPLQGLLDFHLREA